MSRKPYMFIPAHVELDVIVKTSCSNETESLTSNWTSPQIIKALNLLANRGLTADICFHVDIDSQITMA